MGVQNAIVQESIGCFTKKEGRWSKLLKLRINSEDLGRCPCIARRVFVTVDSDSSGNGNETR